MRFHSPPWLLLLWIGMKVVPASAQVDTVSSSFVAQQTETSLDSALLQLAKKYEIGLVYESDLLTGKHITSRPTKTNIDEALDQILAPFHLHFVKVSASTYAIKASESDKRAIISGRVLSKSDGVSLPGVNIRLADKESGTITDTNGSFKIEVSDLRKETLIFTYVGYQKQEVILGTSNYLEVSMEIDDQQLSEVVVTASGVNREKRELVYSVHNVSVERVVNAHETNLVTALSAKVAGLNVVSTSGAPGASASIQIRGRKSINSSNQPLFVLDGMIVSNTTSGNTTGGVDVSNRVIDINPHDIKKITVLKGPAATVLYGSRAANGAIMINTHRGRSGTPKVAFHSETAFSKVNKLPLKQNKYAQGRPTTGIFVYRGPETGEFNSYGPRIDVLEFDGDQNYPYDQQGRLVPKGTGNGVAAEAYDDYDAFWVTGYRLDNNLSVTGGSEVVKYYFSVGHLFESGVIPNSTFERTSIKANIDFDLTEKLLVGVSTSLVTSGGERVRRGSNVSGVTVGLFRNTPTFDIGNGKTGRAASNDPASYQLANGEQRAYRGNALYDNPFWVTNKNPYSDKVNRVIANTYLNYDFLPWLTSSVKLGIDNFIDSRDLAWDINSSSEPSGRVDQSTRFSRRLNADVSFTADKIISPDFSFQTTIGYNYYSQFFETKTSSGTGLSVPGFYDISNATQISSDRSISESKLVGLFGDINLNFKDYLFFHLAGRNDWSSRLPSNDNSFFYPAAGLAFEWIQALGQPDAFISLAKMRISYGQVGNAPSIYQTQDAFRNAIIDGDDVTSGTEFPAFGVNAFERSGRKGNENLRPELTTTLEIGGDFGFFDSRINLDLTYYAANTSDALVTITLPGPTGYTSIVRNTGGIENTGYEIAMQGQLINQTNWKLDLGANFTRNRSLVTSLAPGISRVTLAEFSNVSSINLVGSPFGVFSGTRYRRDEQNQLLIGSDGFPLIDVTQGLIGDPNPDWTLGISSGLRYKYISLSVLWDVKKGGDIWNGTKGVMDYLGISKESGDLREVSGYVYEGVLENGEPNDIPVDFANPAFGLGGIVWRRGGFSGVAEDHIEDASWARMREISLAFSAPKVWLEKLKYFSDLEISLYGRNLWLITDYQGIDPETNLRGPSNAQGWDYFNLPNTKSFGFVLNAKFN